MRILLFALSLAFLGCSPTNNIESHNEPELAGGKTLNANGIYPAQKSVVLLRMINTGKVKGHLCTGSIIGQHTILTAAHCLERLGRNGNEAIDVVFNYQDSSGNLVHQAAVETRVHPNYSNGTQVVTYHFKNIDQQTSFTHLRKFDFALLRLANEIPKGFAPANIETEPIDLSGELVAAYGAGAEGNFQSAKSNAEMLKYLSGRLSRGLFEVRPSEFSGEDFYTIEGKTTEEICGGDSGGPQFLMSADQPTIVGINSARISTPGNENTESCGAASLSTRVSAGADWIEKVLAEFEK